MLLQVVIAGDKLGGIITAIGYLTDLRSNRKYILCRSIRELRDLFAISLFSSVWDSIGVLCSVLTPLYRLWGGCWWPWDEVGDREVHRVYDPSPPPPVRAGCKNLRNRPPPQYRDLCQEHQLEAVDFCCCYARATTPNTLSVQGIPSCGKSHFSYWAL